MNFGLIIELTKRDFMERYSGSVLGFAWSFIYPLITILIYMIIFGNLMGARLPGMSSVWGYGMYLVAGIVPWTAFANTVARSSTVFLDKKNIISKIRVDLAALPLFIVLSETITFCVTFGIFFGILLCTGFVFTPLLLLIPVIYLTQQILAYALGFSLAMLVVFLRDLKEVVSICLQIWFWFTPIVYVYEILPPLAQRVLILNPALSFISAYHDIIVFGRMPSFIYLILVFLLGCLLFGIDYLVFRRLERDIRDFI